MRPVLKGTAAENGYNPPTNLRFTGKYGTALNTIYGTNNPTVAQCLDLWLRKVKQQPVPPGVTQDNFNALVSRIKERVAEIYKTAATPLATRIGSFCSYCETTLPGLIEVEHTVPEANYPTFATDWRNFLLACGPCNNRKSNDPSRAVVKGWMPLVLINPSEEEYWIQIRDLHYVWADQNDPNPWSSLSTKFWAKTGPGANDWTHLPDSAAFNLNNRLINYNQADRTVTAYLASANANFQVAALISHPLVLGAENLRRSQEIIELCGLNYEGNPDSTYDRRLINRTRAWFTALTAIKPMRNVTTREDFEPLWDVLLEMSRNNGFYSTWLTILNHFKIDGQSLGALFYQTSNTELYYPNTNTALLS